MAGPNVIPLRPRYSPAIAAEGWMEIQAQLLTVREFVAGELRRSWERGHDKTRMAELQRADAAIRALDAEAKRLAGWADDTACADGLVTPGHGKAA